MVFECKKSCGYCCTLRVRLSLFDIIRIMRAGYKKKHFLEKDLRGKPVIKMVNGKCYFLHRKNGKARCKIYEHRPKVCREYPFNHKGVKSCEELKNTRWKKRF